MKMATLTVSVVAVIVAIMSFVLAQVAAARSRKAEAVRNLLGEKENVAFGALKLMRDGLPTSDKERKLIVAAVIQACVFEGSDRARALLYRVLELNSRYHREFLDSLRDVEETFDSMDRYGFTHEQLDLSRGSRRIKTVRAVLMSHGDQPRAADLQRS
jgi:hypothetical protein